MQRSDPHLLQAFVETCNHHDVDIDIAISSANDLQNATMLSVTIPDAEIVDWFEMVDAVIVREPSNHTN